MDLTSESPSRLIPCTELGCMAACLSMEELTRHLATDCAIAIRRRALARRSKEREKEKAKQLADLLNARRRKKPEEAEDTSVGPSRSVSDKAQSKGKFKGFTEEQLKRLDNYRASTPEGKSGLCKLCGLPIQGSQLRHDSEQCSHRTIHCPNRSLGCPSSFPLNETSRHLREECSYEKKRSDLAERSRARDEMVICPGCNTEVRVRLQDEHDRDHCANRKVSCRNSFLGCNVMVRVSERAFHEEVDKMAAMKRSCLYFAGGGSDLGIEEFREVCNGGAHIYLGESDIVPPWTVEYWIYRPSPGEVVKSHLRTISVLRAVLKQRIRHEVQLLDRIQVLRDKIKARDAEVLTGKKDAKSAELFGKKQLQLALVLSNVLNLYDEAILLTVATAKSLELHFQACFVAFEAMKLPAEEFSSDPLISIDDAICDTVVAPTEVKEVNETGLDIEAVQEKVDFVPHLIEEPVLLESSLHLVTGDGSAELERETIEAKEAENKELTDYEKLKIAEETEVEDGALSLSNVDDNGIILGDTDELGEVAASSMPVETTPLDKAQQNVADSSLGIQDSNIPKEGMAGNSPTEEVLSLNGQFLVFTSVDLKVSRTWFSWRALVLDLHAELEQHKSILRGFREDSGLLSKQEETQMKDKAATNESGKKKSKAELKAEKEAAKEREKRERSLKKKEMRRLKLIHASENDADEENGDVDASVNVDGGTSKREKTPKGPTKKLNFRMEDIEKCSLAMDIIANSEGGKSTWEMKPTPFHYDEELSTENVPNLDIPEIHQFHNVPTRICLAIPTEKNAEKDKDKEKKGKKKPKRNAFIDTKGKGGVLLAPISSSFSGDAEDGSRPASVIDETRPRASSSFDAGNESIVEEGNVFSKYEERVGIVCSEGVHLFRAPNAVIPYDCWTHVALVCSEKSRQRRTAIVESRSVSRRVSEDILDEYADRDSRSRPSSRPGSRANSPRQVNDENKDTGLHPSQEAAMDAVPPGSLPPTDFIALYLNGVAAGELKGFTCNLPMNSIGASEFSFHGCLLDVRYWAKPKSKIEIMQGMHSVVPMTEKHPNGPDGLVGYWTFEDGTGSTTVADVSEHRYKAQLRGFNTDIRTAENAGRKTKINQLANAKARLERIIKASGSAADRKAAAVMVQRIQQEVAAFGGCLLPKLSTEFCWIEAALLPCKNMIRDEVDDDSELIPVPSFLARGLCPFEIKRFKLAQRGRLLWLEAKCPNGCDAPLRRIDVRFHVRFLCDMTRIRCHRMGCTEFYPLKYRELHERYECIANESRDEILKRAIEANEKVVCDACSQSMKARHFDVHQSRYCMFRTIYCIYKDCAEQMLARNEASHYKYDCRSAYLQRRYQLVARARRNRGYARPWGVDIEYCVEIGSIGEERTEIEGEKGQKLEGGVASLKFAS